MQMPDDLERHFEQRRQSEAALQTAIERHQKAEFEMQAVVKQHQETEAALRAEIAYHKRLQIEAQRHFELSIDKQCVASFDGFFKRLNPAWQETLGYSLEELMARPYTEFLHPDDLESTASETQRTRAGQHSESFENRYRCKDGTYRWFSWRARVVPEEQLVYAAARDITEQKQAAQVLEVAMIQLERSNIELQQFASIASHDLQEPLRAIQTFGDRLQTRHGAALNDEARDYLARMQNAAGRMRALIQDLLAYSRVATQTRPFTLVDLASTVQALQGDLAMRLEETGGRIEVGELPAIEADAMQMRQLFQNLIDNGLKFHREGEPPLIQVYAEHSTGSDASAPADLAPADVEAEPKTSLKAPPSTKPTVRIVVQDNGIGLDEKFADRIFVPFERLHNQRKYGGTGIGLAICRKIAERHGGGIMVKSVPGQGSRFVITIPLQQPEITLEGAA